MSILITGLSVTKGVVIGKAYIMKHGQTDTPEYIIDDDIIDSEIERYTQAIKITRQHLQSIRDKISKAVSADIADFIAAHILTLDESAINREPRTIIRQQKINAEWALKKQSDELIKVFDNIDEPYLQSRKNDILQVTNMILEALNQQDIQPPKSEDGDDARILITDHLTPRDLALLDTQNIVGFVSEHDAPNSHTAIMARSFGIPIITDIHNINKYIEDGEKILMDGKYGTICINPDEKSINFYQKLIQKIAVDQQNLQQLISRPTITQDCKKIGLQINIDNTYALDALNTIMPEAVGLYRSESLYQKQDALPDEESQLRVYQALAAQNIPITIRTLDLEINQHLPKTYQNSHINNMLGLRAIRFSLFNPDIFITQLRAIMRASVNGNIRIMLPMIISLDEILQTKIYLEQIKDDLRQKDIPFDENIQIGMMVETPAAAISLELFINHIDFFAIGTNDLLQYILAIDRSNELVNGLYNPTHPAFLNLIHKLIKTADDNEKSIYVCGEMASDIQYTRLLLGMGLRNFSVNPGQFLEIKNSIREAHIGDAELYVNEILKSSKPKRIKELINNLNNA